MIILQLERLLILHILQPFSKWTQRNFGIDCFDWSLVFILASIICNAIGIMIFMSYVHPVSFLVSFVFHSVLLKCSIDFLFNKNDDGLVRRKKLVYEELASGVASRYLILPRLSFVFFIPVMINHIGEVMLRDIRMSFYIIVYSVEAYWLSMAFASCTPLPPGNSRVSNLLRKTKRKITSAFSPKPKPLPV